MTSDAEREGLQKASELWNAKGPWCDKCGAPILDGRTEFLRAIAAAQAQVEAQAEETIPEVLTKLRAARDSASGVRMRGLDEAIAIVAALSGPTKGAE